ncbi:hypothetical protein CAOG_08744, partial [Capsaspora owczarzaki ATCC 30864]|uniref:hypothetical protein n=1 Tax=Capsaspora owczarzaki (strain ATCC 30864) TaxID=595528 RepID=UPI0003524693
SGGGKVVRQPNAAITNPAIIVLVDPKLAQTAFQQLEQLKICVRFEWVFDSVEQSELLDVAQYEIRRRTSQATRVNFTDKDDEISLYFHAVHGDIPAQIQGFGDHSRRAIKHRFNSVLQPRFKLTRGAGAAQLGQFLSARDIGQARQIAEKMLAEAQVEEDDGGSDNEPATNIRGNNRHTSHALDADGADDDADLLPSIHNSKAASHHPAKRLFADAFAGSQEPADADAHLRGLRQRIEDLSKRCQSAVYITVRALYACNGDFELTERYMLGYPVPQTHVWTSTEDEALLGQDDAARVAAVRSAHGDEAVMARLQFLDESS